LDGWLKWHVMESWHEITGTIHVVLKVFL